MGEVRETLKANGKKIQDLSQTVHERFQKLSETFERRVQVGKINSLSACKDMKNNIAASIKTLRLEVNACRCKVRFQPRLVDQTRVNVSWILMGILCHSLAGTNLGDACGSSFLITPC